MADVIQWGNGICDKWWNGKVIQWGNGKCDRVGEWQMQYSGGMADAIKWGNGRCDKMGEWQIDTVVEWQM
jgi:hypothetical protein